MEHNGKLPSSSLNIYLAGMPVHCRVTGLNEPICPLPPNRTYLFAFFPRSWRFRHFLKRPLPSPDCNNQLKPPFTEANLSRVAPTKKYQLSLSQFFSRRMAHFFSHGQA